MDKETETTGRDGSFTEAPGSPTVDELLCIAHSCLTRLMMRDQSALLGNEEINEIEFAEDAINAARNAIIAKSENDEAERRASGGKTQNKQETK